MALLRCDFFSEVLEMGTSMTVLLPQPGEAQIGVSAPDPDASPGSGDRDAPPVLYLLHGLSDDATAWTRYTSIERYAAERGVAVVMPQVARSFYADEVAGLRFWTFLSEELPSVVGSFFRVSARREDTFVAGLSMGGYGALKWALHQPERFAAAASLSGALDVVELTRVSERRELFGRVFDGGVATPEDDLFALVDRADAVGAPAWWLGCGTEDELCDSSRRLAAAAQRAGLDVHLELRPGEHEWGLWDEAIRDVLAWLPVRH